MSKIKYYTNTESKFLRPALPTSRFSRSTLQTLRFLFFFSNDFHSLDVRMRKETG